MTTGRINQVANRSAIAMGPVRRQPHRPHPLRRSDTDFVHHLRAQSLAARSQTTRDDIEQVLRHATTPTFYQSLPQIPLRAVNIKTVDMIQSRLKTPSPLLNVTRIDRYRLRASMRARWQSIGQATSSVCHQQTAVVTCGNRSKTIPPAVLQNLCYIRIIRQTSHGQR